MKKYLLLFLVFISCLGFSKNSLHPLNPSMTADIRNYGSAVALFEDHAVVGDPDEIVSGTDSGGCWHFRFNGTDWDRIGRISDPLGQSGELFGATASMHGDFLAVGAPGYNGDSGKVILYKKNASGNWLYETTIQSPGFSQGARFGASLDLDGTRLIVGAPEHSGPNTTHQGAAAVITLGGSYPVEAILTAQTSNSFDFFGRSVSIDGNRLAVGAPKDDLTNDGNEDRGSIQFFVHQGSQWVYDGGPFFRDNGQSGDYFGFSVSLDGERAMVSAIGVDLNAQRYEGYSAPNSAGLVIFLVEDSSGWRVEAEISSEHPLPGDLFGYALSLQGDVALAGARESGAVTLLNRIEGNWMIRNVMELGGEWGTAVALYCDKGLAGDPSGTGAAFAFEATLDVLDLDPLTYLRFDGPSMSRQGRSVAMSKQDVLMIVAGAPLSSALVNGAGDVDVRYFYGETWQKAAWATGSRWKSSSSTPDIQTTDGFGHAVALGEYLAVGAPYHDSDGVFNSGAVYILDYYRTSACVTEPCETYDMVLEVVQKITPPVPVAGGSFGYSLAMDGDRLVIGTKDVLVYRLQNGVYVHEQTLTKPASATAAFGVSVGLSGNTIIVGNPHGPWPSSVFFYEFTEGSGWIEDAALAPTGFSDIRNVGGAVAIDGDYAFFGFQSRQTSYPGNIKRGLVIAERSSSGQWVKVRQTQDTGSSEYRCFDVQGSMAVAGHGDAPVYLISRDASGVWGFQNLYPNFPGLGSSAALFENYLLIGAELQDSMVLYEKEFLPVQPCTP